MLEALMSTPEGRARLEAYEEKVDQALADRIEDADKGRSEDPQPRPLHEVPGPEPRAATPAGLVPAAARSELRADHRSEEEQPDDTEDHPRPNDENDIDDDADEDADMDVMNEEQIGVVHEDIEDEISGILLAQLGQPGRSYRRDFKKASRHLVSEIYSPPRITQEIKRGRYRRLAPRLCDGSYNSRPGRRSTVGFLQPRQARESA